VGGNWTVADKLNASAGSWVLQANATDERGAVSALTNGVTVTVGDWFANLMGLLVEWASVIITAILLFSVVVGIVYAIRHRYSVWRITLKRNLLKVRGELRSDLKNIEQELEYGQPEKRAHMTVSEIHKQEERIQEEIAHIDADLKKEIKTIDELEEDDS
jgi:Flp pilus assembly protein TadB